MPKTTGKHLSFFMRWVVRYNAELFYLQTRMPEVPDLPDERLARSLDARRRAAHQKILSVVSGYGHLCGACGRCCLERVERYTDFDQFIHAGVGEPLEHFDRRILNLPSMMANSVKRKVEHLIGSETSGQEPCRYLSESGCSLPHQKRPILCVSWFCPKYVFGMQPASLDSLEEPLTEILSIHREIAASVSSKGKAK